MPLKDLDIILHGATGFTGRLTAAHLVPLCLERGLRIGLGGRTLAGLEKVRDDIGAPHDIPLVIASSADPEGLQAMVQRTACVVSMVGPYQLHGTGLVQACALNGTDYVDVNGEPAWMAEMIRAHEQQAQASGARILFSCGFDSVPFDLGVFFLQAAAIERTGEPLKDVASRVKMRGVASAGSIKTNSESNNALLQSHTAAALATDPYSLIPGFEGVPQPDLHRVCRDGNSQEWLAPFIMAPINSKSVHRTNYLLRHRYGPSFTYDEMFVAGAGENGRELAERLSAQGDIVSYLAAASAATSQYDNAAGFYQIDLFGAGSTSFDRMARIRADHDPGYESTSRIATQVTALLNESPHSSLPGGIWTPAAAFGATLIEKLQAAAGISFVMLPR